MTDTSSHQHRDVFLCHAHADKDTFVRPVAEALRLYGVSSWLDEAEIKVGDHITEKINEGLRGARFVVVFVTPEFVGRNWPNAELNAAFGIEMRKREVVVLPVLSISHQEWAERFPLLADKLFLRWSAGVESIAREIADRVGTVFQEEWLHHYPAEYEGPIWIRVLPFGSRRGVKHRVVLRWGPWRCKRTFKSDGSAVCLVSK